MADTRKTDRRTVYTKKAIGDAFLRVKIKLRQLFYYNMIQRIVKQNTAEFLALPDKPAEWMFTQKRPSEMPFCGSSGSKNTIQSRLRIFAARRKSCNRFTGQGLPRIEMDEQQQVNRITEACRTVCLL